MTQVTQAIARQSKKLTQLEKLIDKNIKAAWYQNGLILTKIRDEKVYQKDYPTFEDYLEKRWDFGKSRTYQIMDAASLTQKIAFFGKNNNSKSPLKVELLPSSETHLRPLLTDLKTDSERVKVWQKVIEDSQVEKNEKGEKVKITAAYVQEKVSKFIESGEVVDDIDFSEVNIKNVTSVHVGQNSGENEWYTPAKFIESARVVMGSINLDPASSEIANKTVQADNIFTKDDNGLEREWFPNSNVWLNPPYAQPLMNQFAEKLIKELPNINQAITLVNNATETKWFQSWLEKCSAVCFPSSRIKFLDPKGNATGSPLQGQAIFYFGKNRETFKDEFLQYGAVFYHA